MPPTFTMLHTNLSAGGMTTALAPTTVKIPYQNAIVVGVANALCQSQTHNNGTREHQQL
ncbi:MAG: hypothetical protein IT212_10380 [Bacteroidia bacterium]|nr:hypothetical protein [Bacteroidia bacterium]